MSFADNLLSSLPQNLSANFQNGIMILGLLMILTYIDKGFMLTTDSIALVDKGS